WGISPQPDPLAARVCDQIRRHIDGLVIGPAMVALARAGVLAQLETEPASLSALLGNRASLTSVFELLATQGWIALDQNAVSLTPCGRYAAQIATSYGGTFLEHLYSVVRKHTARGQVLDKHPLVIVGADFNKVARRVAKQTLRKAGIPNAHVIHGDINRPALLAGDLEELGLDIHDLLH